MYVQGGRQKNEKVSVTRDTQTTVKDNTLCLQEGKIFAAENTTET